MTPSQPFKILSALTFACALASSAVAADPAPAPRDLGTLGGDASFARGMNDRGDVVGDAETAAGETHAFLWRGGSLIDLGTLGGPFSTAHAIDNQGRAVGSSAIPGGFGTRAVVWSRGTITALPALDGGPFSEALATNDRGQIVGASNGAPVLWSGGSVTRLAEAGYATGINARGEIVLNGPTASGAFHGFLWRGGTLVDLGTLGGPSSSANDINDRGEIVGQSDTASGAVHAFVWRNGVMTDLGAIGAYSFARAISNAGVIAGEGQTDDGTRALRWSADGRIAALGTLAGSSFSAGFAGNARGDVAGVSFTAAGPRAVVWQTHGACRK